MANRCGVAWRTLLLAIMTAFGSTLLGLAFALVATRTRFPFKKGLRLLTILPIITPPFVIGLALILLFGRAGVVTQQLSNLFGIEPGRWLYGLTGIWIAQVLSFTPISFLVLIGVVEGVSPSMEEASQTLRADRWRTFWKVSLPLMKPGLANAFLIGFIESMADFGNPLVLGGSHGVLSTEIFFAVVGSQNDPSRAAVLAIILLFFTLSAFLAQRFWLAGKSFATVTGKGDSGAHIALPRSLSIGVHAVVIPWIIVHAGHLRHDPVRRLCADMGSRQLPDASSTTQRAFSFSFENGAIAWTGVAWNSFWTTMKIALISAPLTAAVGLLTAYLIVRQRFVGRNVFEFALMMSFAIPGTVIGISYIMAFNLPPLEMTGTALILIACFVFRNMPVGVRGGVAAMSQLDKSLDEASLTLAGDELPHDPQGHPALASPRDRGCAGLFIRPCHHLDQRCHIPGQRRVQYGDFLHRRPRRERRIRRGRRLLVNADCRHDRHHHLLPAAGGRDGKLRRENRVATGLRSVCRTSREGRIMTTHRTGSVVFANVKKQFGTFTAIHDLSLTSNLARL